MKVPEPDDFAKDADGYTWFRDPNGGWTLKAHEEFNCYSQLPWPKVENTYGPMFPLQGS